MVHLTPERLFSIFRLLGKCDTVWPPDKNAKRTVVILQDIATVLITTNMAILGLGLLFAAYVHRSDVFVLVKAVSEFFALLEAFFHVILCRWQRKRLQIIITQIGNFFHTCQEDEKIVVQKYVDRYKHLFLFSQSLLFVTVVSFFIGPLLLNMEFPSDAIYPFSIETTLRKRLIYVQQVVAIFHVSLSVAVDHIISMFLWYSTVRLELLSIHLKKATNAVELKICIGMHQEILKFTEDIQEAVLYILCKSNFLMVTCAILSAIPLIYNPPFVVMCQFLPMLVVLLQKILITSWPADDLKEMSETVGQSVYSCSWVNGCSRMRSGVLFMRMRCQKLILISIGPLFPALTLEYYKGFISTIMSYFMTMRALVDPQDALTNSTILE